MKIKLEGIIRSMELYSADDLKNLTVKMTSHRVWLNDQELDWEKSLSIQNHSPGGPNWGYEGSGPSQLALAVCMELFGEHRAQKIYQDFKRQFIVRLPFDQDFEVELDVSGFIQAHLEKFEQADQEAEEDRLWKEELKQLEEQERKYLEEHPELMVTQRPVAESTPDTIERLSQIPSIKYSYKGYSQCDCVCNLIVSQKHDLVIVTEIAENEGTSITNMAEHLAMQICQEFNLNPEKLLYMEHYSHKSYQGGRESEDFDLVSFEKDSNGRFLNPQWQSLSLKEMEEFIALLD